MDRGAVTAWVDAYERVWRTLTNEYRDLWVTRYAGDGRCRSFEEWPFAPSD
jgi:hypothetical protein